MANLLDFHLHIITTEGMWATYVDGPKSPMLLLVDVAGGGRKFIRHVSKFLQISYNYLSLKLFSIQYKTFCMQCKSSAHQLKPFIYFFAVHYPEHLLVHSLWLFIVFATSSNQHPTKKMLMEEISH